MLAIAQGLLLLGASTTPQALPDLVLPELHGEERSLAQWQSEGPMLLDFWATWCVPCRAAFPHYARLAERYAEQGFRVVTVSQDQPGQHKRIAPLLEKLGVSLPVLLDAKGELGQAMGVLSLPTALLIDAQGQVVYRHVGFLPGDERALEAKLRALLKLPASDGAAAELAHPDRPH